MSRCFPFPPPGYEKKSRPDDANLLIKEKSKEKRHKKEKKDEEKKEKKEKRDKERSEGKRREKKEKKHKHEDKKDKERDKEKRRTSENKKVSVTSVHRNGGKPSPTGILGTDSQPQLLLELEKRLRNDNGATESRRVEKIIAPDQDSVCLQGKFTEIKEKPKDKREDHRMVNGQTFKVVAKGLENGVASSFMGEDRKKVEGGICAVEKVDEKCKGRKEKKKHKNSDGKGDKHQDRDQKKQNKSNKKVEKEKKKEERSRLQIKQSSIDTADNGSLYLFSESSWSNGILGKRKDPETNEVLHDNDSRSCKLSRPLSSSRQLIQNGSKYDPSQDHKGNDEVPFHKSVLGNGRKLDPGHIVHGFVSEQKSRVSNLKVPNSLLVTQPVEGAGRELESCQAARNFTHLEPGVVVGNHMVNNKVSSSQPVVEKQGRSNFSQPNIHTSVKSRGPFCPSKMGNKKHVINGLIKTQESTNIIEEVETHKSPLHLNSEYPSQILSVDNKVSSFQPVVENLGRSDCSQPNIHKAVESQGLLCPPKVDNKKNEINGLIKTQPPKKVKEVEAQKRPPHPDSKYLNQILTVPEVEWSDYDDQEWLFSSGASKAKKPRTVSSEIDETKQVWAEVLRIESADLVALPYVIPY